MVTPKLVRCLDWKQPLTTIIAPDKQSEISELAKWATGRLMNCPVEKLGGTDKGIDSTNYAVNTNTSQWQLGWFNATWTALNHKDDWWYSTAGVTMENVAICWRNGYWYLKKGGKKKKKGGKKKKKRFYFGNSNFASKRSADHRIMLLFVDLYWATENNFENYFIMLQQSGSFNNNIRVQIKKRGPERGGGTQRETRESKWAKWREKKWYPLNTPLPHTYCQGLIFHSCPCSNHVIFF